MNEQALKRLEYDKVKQQVAGYAISYLGSRRVEDMQPSLQAGQVKALLDETEEAKDLYEKSSSIPLPSLEGMEWVMGHLGKGYILAENDFTAIGTFLHSVSQLKKFMSRWESAAPMVSLYARGLHAYAELREEIDRSIRNGRISDTASPELGKVRRQILVLEDRIKKKLDALLSKHKSILQEAIVSKRSGRYVIPVKKEHRRLIPGTVLDESSSGQTVFVEPVELAALQAEINELVFQESVEEQKVLAHLTGLVEMDAYALQADLEVIGHYDFLFAKAKYACAVGGRNVEWRQDGVLRIRQGRHPLLGSKMVPIDFAIGESYRALIITGPNTGGKTVALKTVGLLCLLAQSGLLPPVAEGSILSMFRTIEADIGDGQSLEQSLSTFSAHVRNLIGVLERADHASLVLLDELASGTDPGEGIGLSIAVLEELHRRGSTVIATTHYNEIKEFAAAAPGFRNARMEFNTETLEPLYRLTIGEAGSSYAFHIALKLGMDPQLIERSREISAGAGHRRSNSGYMPSGMEVKPQEAKSTENKSQNAGAKKEAAPPVRAETNTADAQKPRGKRDFSVGDCVYIHPLKRTGIVFRTADDRGMVVVQVQKEKLTFNRKRLSLYIEGRKLYPEGNYDMDIVFESKDVRKKRHEMSRKHVEGLTVEIKRDDG